MSVYIEGSEWEVIGPVPEKPGPMTSHADDCQTGTGPRKPGPVPVFRQSNVLAK